MSLVFFEELEPRMMLSAGMIFVGGYVEVDGTSKGDHVVISHDVLNRPSVDGGNEVYHLIIAEIGKGRSAQTHQLLVRDEDMLGLRVMAGDGNDRVSAHLRHKFDLLVDTGDGNDRIKLTVVEFSGENSLDVIAGNGNDRVDFEVRGNQQEVGYRPAVYGGAGNDKIRVLALRTTSVSGEEGDDRITLRGQEEGVYHYLSGGEGNDRIVTSAPSTIYGNAGRNTLISTSKISAYFGGTGERDTMIGGDGTNVYDLYGGEYRISAGGGDDVIQIHRPLKSLRLNGGRGVDTLSFRSGISFERFQLRDIEVLNEVSSFKG